MLRPTLSLLILLALSGQAAADCYADYKAKQDNPLRLAYGVAQVGDKDCTKKKARKELEPRLQAGGWTLLDVMSVFGPEGLAERKDRAAENYLRY